MAERMGLLEAGAAHASDPIIVGSEGGDYLRQMVGAINVEGIPEAHPDDVSGEIGVG